MSIFSVFPFPNTLRAISSPEPPLLLSSGWGNKRMAASGNEIALSETKICKRRAPASLLCGGPPGKANHNLFHLTFRISQWLPSLESIGSASLSSDFDGWQVSWWEAMVSCWHSCTFISWEKPRELPHFIFLLSLKLHDSKLMLKLYYLRAPTSLWIGCDRNVALDSELSQGAWNLKFTTPDWKKQSVEGKTF